MYRKGFFKTFILAALLSVLSCSGDPPGIDFCFNISSGNPVNQLPWLKNKVKIIQEDGIEPNPKIYSYIYNQQEVVSIEYDDHTEVYFCNGNLWCTIENGNINGPCDNFLTEASEKQLIWEG